MRPRNRFIVLGVDGLDWEYVREHSSSLPVLSSWPVLAPLRSIFPPDSIPAWTTIFTGTPPGEHGIIESIDYLGKRPTAAADAAAAGMPGRTFWDAAGRRGRTVCVVNAFMAYPAWDVNGVMVSGPVFVDGGLSVTGATVEDVTPAPELGGIVSFPTPKTIGTFVDETIGATQQQAEYGVRLLERFDPDLLFLNILTLDRMQHFLWRFCDPGDPTYPGANEHADAIRESYALVDSIAARFAELGSVMLLSDHGHGRRPTRMLFVDEALRRAGLVEESRRLPAPLSRNYLLERAKRSTLAVAYRAGLEHHAYAVGRHLPGRKAIKQSTFSTNAQRSAVRLSRAFGRNQHGGLDVRDDDPALCARAIEVMEAIRDPQTDAPVVDWIVPRAEMVNGSAADRYPSILFKLRDGYGVDFGIYGKLFGPDVNHRRVSGGHREDGVLACSFTPTTQIPASLEGVHDFVLACIDT